MGVSRCFVHWVGREAKSPDGVWGAYKFQTRVRRWWRMRIIGCPQCLMKEYVMPEGPGALLFGRVGTEWVRAVMVKGEAAEDGRW
jgi:hypothetical protein